MNKLQEKKDLKMRFALLVGGIAVVIILIIIISLLLVARNKKAQLEVLSTQPEELSFEPHDDILSADVFDSVVQVGATTLNMPCVYSELMGTGVVVTDTSYSDNYLLEPAKTIEVPMQLDDMSFTVTVYNDTTDVLKLCDTKVIGFSNIAGCYITLPGGVAVGTSDFDLVTELWGNADAVSSKNGNNGNLMASFYRDGVTNKDIYAYESGGTRTNDASGVSDIGGYSYDITYNRSSGVVTSISASFTQKKGLEAYVPITYRFDGVKVSFNILEDSFDIGDDMLYCVEQVDGVDYVIGIGAANGRFNEAASLLDPDKSSNSNLGSESIDAVGSTEATDVQETSINSLGKKMLSYSDYDFSNNFVQLVNDASYKSYLGEYVSDTVYMAVDAEMQRKYGVSLVFYMHPLGIDSKITENALNEIRIIENTARESLVFE